MTQRNARSKPGFEGTRPVAAAARFESLDHSNGSRPSILDVDTSDEDIRIDIDICNRPSAAQRICTNTLVVLYGRQQ